MFTKIVINISQVSVIYCFSSSVSNFFPQKMFFSFFIFTNRLKHSFKVGFHNIRPLCFYRQYCSALTYLPTVARFPYNIARVLPYLIPIGVIMVHFSTYARPCDYQMTCANQIGKCALCYEKLFYGETIP